MTDKPILFSGPMVRALLDGRKTQTRRVAKITAVMGDKVGVTSPNESLIEMEPGEFHKGIFHYESVDALSGPYHLPYAIGDHLWVREGLHRDPDLWRYRADDEEVGWPARRDLAYRKRDYLPSIHMPRWASRLTLVVTDVRVQRLQEISAEDAQAEGVQPVHDPASDTGEPAYLNYQDNGEAFAGLGAARLSFMTLWDSLNAKLGYG